MELRLGTRTFAPTDVALMAIINRTPDSFFDRGATFGEAEALDAADRAVAEGAEILDIGGVKAAPGRRAWTRPRSCAGFAGSSRGFATATRTSSSRSTPGAPKSGGPSPRRVLTC